MTLQEIRESSKDMLTVHDICKIVGIDQNRIMWQARENPNRLGFPVCVAGRTVRIPRKAFVRWMDGENNANCSQEQSV